MALKEYAQRGRGGVLGLGPRLGVDSMPPWEVSKQPDNLTTDRTSKEKSNFRSLPCETGVNMACEEAVD